MIFFFRVTFNLFLRLFSPGYFYCYRCERPRIFAKEHITNVTQSWGCFPLCERCFKELGTAKRRIPYYKRLVHDWLHKGCIETDEVVPLISAIEKAVIRESNMYPLNKKHNSITKED